MRRITRKAGLRTAWLLLGALCVHWCVLAFSTGWKDCAQARVPRLDEARNLHEAAALRAGEWWPAEGQLQPPGMRWVLAPLSGGRLPGDGFALAEPLPLRWRLAQIAAWALAVLALLLGARGGHWPLAAPALLALSTLAASSVLRPLPEIWILALVATQLFVQRLGSTRTRGLEGFVIGLAALFRPTLAVLLLPSLWRSRRAPWPLLLGFALPLLPFAIAQSVQMGRPCAPSLNAGINLYIGNAGAANGLFQSGRSYNFARDPSGRAWLQDLGVVETGNAADVDRAWRRLAFHEIGERPLRTLELYAHKLRYLLVASELPQISSVEAWRRAVPGLTPFALPYGLLVVLAAAALAGLRETPWLRTVALGLLLLLLAHALFFVVGRFRVAFVPGLCVLGAHGLVLLWRRRPLAWALALLAVLCVIPWGMGSLERSLRAASLLEEGERHRLWALHLGVDQPRAERELALADLRLQEALELSPQEARIHRALARVVYLREGREAAIRALRRGIESGADGQALREDLQRLGAQR